MSLEYFATEHFVTLIFYNGFTCLFLPASKVTQVRKLRKKISNPSQIFDTRILEMYRLHRWDNNKVARREYRIRRSVFFHFNAIANKGLSNRRSTKKSIPSFLPGARSIRRRSISKECIGWSLERALALSPVRCAVRGLEVVRGVGEGNVKRERVAAVVRRTRKVEGWLGGTGGAVRAQHDAIRAGTRRSLRSERRDASAESVAWIARSVIAGTRGVPLSSRITLAVCSAEGVVSLLSSCEPPRREEGRRGGVPYHRSCSCVSIRPEELSLSLFGWPRTDSALEQPGWFLSDSRRHEKCKNAVFGNGLRSAKGTILSL